MTEELTLEEVVKNHRCYDCRGWDSCYMVHDEVWAKAWPDYREVRKALVQQYGSPPVNGLRKDRIFLCLCFGCLEKRLGRPLELGDFKRAPINEPIFFGYRMRERQIGKPTSGVAIGGNGNEHQC